MEDFKQGACASLNRTLTELLEYVAEPRPRSRGDLRASVNELIADLAFDWLEYGFYLGHRQAYRQRRDEGEIKAQLIYKEAAWEVTPGCYRSLDLSSRIRRN